MLQIRYQFTNILALHSGDGRRLAQPSFALFSFTRQQVSFEASVTLNLAAGGDFEPFRRSPFTFDFGHLDFPFLRLAFFGSFESPV